MKITKERLIEIIKEELQNTQNTNEAAYASDEEEFAARDAESRWSSLPRNGKRP